jgi:hypothetical protein
MDFFLKKKSGLKDEDVIMLVDFRDTFFTGDTDHILDKFNSTDGDFIISGEQVCWPDKDLEKYYDSNLHFPYVNSGGIIGYAGAWKHIMFNYMKTVHEQPIGKQWDKYWYCDQYHYTCLYLNYPGLITVDWKTEFFFVLNWDEDRGATDQHLELKDGRMRNKIHDTYPLVFHEPGAQFDRLDMIFKKVYK